MGDATQGEKRPETLDEATARRIDQHQAGVDEAYAAYADLRGKCPVVHSEAHGGYYMLLQHGDVRAAALDWQAFSSARRGVALPQSVEGPRLLALEQDPPDHTPVRKLYTDAVAPAALRAMEPKVERIADELIDVFAASGRCDLVRDYCEPLPALGIAGVLGLTGARAEEIRSFAVALSDTAGEPESVGSTQARLAQFVLGEIYARRKEPKDDYLTTIALAEIDGRRLDDQDIAIFMIGFLVAGHETTASALAGLLYYVLGRPDIHQRLIEDDKAMAAAIEEAVRLTSPFHGFSRTTTCPVEMSGAVIPEDQTVRLCYAAANRDPAVFPDPDDFSIERGVNPHLGFGAGRHACAGAPFARMEMRIAVRRLLTRLPDIRLAEDHLNWRFAGGMMTIPERLEAIFAPMGAKS